MLVNKALINMNRRFLMTAYFVSVCRGLSAVIQQAQALAEPRNDHRGVRFRRLHGTSLTAAANPGILHVVPWPDCMVPFRLLGLPIIFCLSLTPIAAEDWPEWRGQGRLGVWRETGIIETFPKAGLKVRWSTPIAAGYSGPAVAGGRVYVTDYRQTEPNEGFERVICLDEKTGKVLWAREWRGRLHRSRLCPGTARRADRRQRPRLHSRRRRGSALLRRRDRPADLETQLPQGLLRRATHLGLLRRPPLSTATA